MSAPSFPSPSFQPRRNLSQNAQLPLPSTLSAQSPTRSQFCSSAPSGNTSRPNSPHRSTPTTPQRPRGMSVLTNRTLGANFSPSSPNATPSPHNRSTHAGGIQPSAPFFRPSRPDYQENYSRPSSFASSDDITAEHVLEVDVYPLSRLSPAASPTRTHTATGENEGGALVEEHIGVVKLDDQEEALHEENVQGGAEYGRSIRKTKQSKEPLLPISGRPGGLGTRGSLSKRDQTLMGLGVSVPDGVQDRGNRLSGGSLMKTGIDRVFSIGRGLSLESIRRSIGGDEVAAKEIGGRRTPMNGTANHIAYIHRTSTSPSRSRYKYTSGHFPGAAKRHSHSLSVSRHTPISPSPDPSFVSQPPENLPHLNSVPMKDPKTGRVVRRYERHPSRNRFFLRGHLLTGGDSPWAFIICLSIVLGLSGVWFATTCVWWWHNESPAVAIVGAYMALIVISSMLTTAFTDPGILPRDLDLNPPYNADGENATPLPRDLRVRNDTVRVKYCTTCKTYRPPRASHCKMCDNCVDGCDHHCQWVNNCVGRRNYASFFVLLLTATLTLILVICTSALHLYLLTVKDHTSFQHALGKAPGSGVAFGMSICIIWPVAALLTYHVRLLVLNITTIEQIRNQAHKTVMPGAAPPNPFTHGTWLRNLAEMLCRPRGFSWLNASGITTEDKRQVNPGMFDNLWDGGSGIGIAQNHTQT